MRVYYQFFHLLKGTHTSFATFAAMKVILKKKISNRVPNGHPWIYANEVNSTEDGEMSGQIAEVYTHDKKFIRERICQPEISDFCEAA